MKRALRRSLQTRPLTWTGALATIATVLIGLAEQSVLEGKLGRTAFVVGGALLGWAFGPSPGMIRVPKPPKLPPVVRP